MRRTAVLLLLAAALASAQPGTDGKAGTLSSAKLVSRPELAAPIDTLLRQCASQPAQVWDFTRPTI